MKRLKGFDLNRAKRLTRQLCLVPAKSLKHRIARKSAVCTAWHTRNAEGHVAVVEYGTVKRTRTKQGPRHSGELHPAQITSLLKNVSTYRALHAAVTNNVSSMNYIHASAAITKLAKLLKEDNSTAELTSICRCCDAVCSLVMQHLPEFQARALANTLWATSKVFAYIEGLHSGDVLTIPQSCQQSLRELSNLANEVLKLVPGSLYHFETQHVCNCMYALAMLQQHSRPHSMNINASLMELSNVQEVSPKSSLDVLGIQPVAKLLLDASGAHLPHMTSQGLANCLWSVAVLGLEPDEYWMDSILDHQDLLARSGNAKALEAQHISNSLWAIAKLGFYPGDEYMDIMVDASVPRLNGFTCQGLVNMLWAVATLEARVPDNVLAALLQACCKAAPEFTSQDMGNAMWAIAKLYTASASELSDVDLDAKRTSPGLENPGSLPSPGRVATTSDVHVKKAIMLRKAAYHILKVCSSPQQVNNASWWDEASSSPPITRGEGLSSASRNSDDAVQMRPAVLLRATPQQLANTIWATCKLDLQPPASWYHLFWRISDSQLKDMNAQELSNTLHSLAALHTAHLERHHINTPGEQPISESPTGTTMTGQASIPGVRTDTGGLPATPGATPAPASPALPPEGWWSSWCHASAVRMLTAEPQHLVNSVVAVTSLGMQPNQQWWFAFMQQVRRLRGSLNPRVKANILWSSARLNMDMHMPWIASVLLISNTHNSSTASSRLQVDSKTLVASGSERSEIDSASSEAPPGSDSDAFDTCSFSGYGLKEMSMVAWSVARALTTSKTSHDPADTTPADVAPQQAEQHTHQDIVQDLNPIIHPLLVAATRQLRTIMASSSKEAAGSRTVYDDLDEAHGSEEENFAQQEVVSGDLHQIIHSVATLTWAVGQVMHVRGARSNHKVHAPAGRDKEYNPHIQAWVRAAAEFVVVHRQVLTGHAMVELLRGMQRCQDVVNRKSVADKAFVQAVCSVVQDVVQVKASAQNRTPKSELSHDTGNASAESENGKAAAGVNVSQFTLLHAAMMIRLLAIIAPDALEPDWVDSNVNAIVKCVYVSRGLDRDRNSQAGKASMALGQVAEVKVLLPVMTFYDVRLKLR